MKGLTCFVVLDSCRLCFNEYRVCQLMLFGYCNMGYLIKIIASLHFEDILYRTVGNC